MVDRLKQTLDPSLFSFALEKANKQPASISVIAEAVPCNGKSAKPSFAGKFAFLLPGHNQSLPASGSKSLPAKIKESPCKVTLQKSPMDDLEKEIRRLKLAQDPVRLDSAEAFVLEVTPEQLQKLARCELVGRVRPNREHHAGTIS